jgi:uncharacterized protein (DUF58 family)
MWKKLKAWVRPPRQLKITGPGRIYLLITMGVGLGALNTGNNLLYLVLGMLLSLIVASGVLSERCLQQLVLKRVLPDGVFAKEPFALRYEIRRKSGRAFALSVGEAESALVGEAWVPIVESDKARVVRATSTAPKRGPLTLTGIKVTTLYPFGLFAKSRVFDVTDVLLVYPRRGFVCSNPAEDHTAQPGDGGNPRRRDGTGDLLGLRPLADGEDARHIHWRKSAAAGELLRTEREREERRQFMLTVDGALEGDALDRRCEEAAAQTQRLLSFGHEVGLKAGSRRLRASAGPGQERRLLTALAWVGFESAPQERKTR